MSIPEIIKNKPITLQGLQDYNKQLRYEIPRMGLGNRVEGDFSYAFGCQNTILSNGVTAIGYQLKVEGTRDPESPLFIIGKQNKNISYDKTTAFIIGGGDSGSLVPSTFN